ncbi:hypothetical protein Tco_1241873, partial [Tanacetum coccineum]
MHHSRLRNLQPHQVVTISVHHTNCSSKSGKPLLVPHPTHTFCFSGSTNLLQVKMDNPDITLEEYIEVEAEKGRRRDSIWSSTRMPWHLTMKSCPNLRPKIEDMDSFELKGQFLKELRDNTFSGSDHEDANEHTEKVLEIVDLFHIPNITIDQVMLRAFPVSLIGA